MENLGLNQVFTVAERLREPKWLSVQVLMTR